MATLDEWRDQIEALEAAARAMPKPKARPPLVGLGPPGETCGTCVHAVKVAGGARYFYKCELNRDRWTHGAGTDIRLRDLACSLWQGPEQKTPG